MSNCGNKPCGCAEEALTTGSPCNNTGDCEKEPCSELFCEECIIHCQPEISVPLPNNEIFTIAQGARWDEIIQRLMILSSNPSCINDAPVGLRLMCKTTTSIRIQWVPSTTCPTEYEVSWTKSNTQTNIGTTENTEFEIINLTPNTEYAITVTDKVSGCSSVTMKILTNLN